MASWETYDPHLDEQYHRNFVLKQPSIVGPWVAFGLGITLLAFLGSLVYVNFLLPPPPSVSPERSLRPETELASARARLKRSTQHSLERRKKIITVVPQGRAPNALLGGQGPALPPEHRPQADTPPISRVPPQTSSGRQ